MKITPEAASLYAELRHVYLDGDGDRWSDQLDRRIQLDRALGRTEPWLSDLFDTIGDGPCPHSLGTAAYLDWAQAIRVRRALDAAIGVVESATAPYLTRHRTDPV